MESFGLVAYFILESFGMESFSAISVQCRAFKCLCSIYNTLVVLFPRLQLTTWL